MSLFKGRSRDGLVASASVVNPRDHLQVKRLAAAQRRWQHDAWSFYDQLAEIHYPANFIGSAISRFMFRVGEIPVDDPMADPVVPDSRKRSEIYREAEDIMNALQGDVGGASQLARSHAMNMTVAAEGWLTGEDRADDTNWEFLSIKEVRPTPEGDFQRFYYGFGAEPEAFTPHYIRRFWKAHPGQTGVADSALAALSGDCNRLIALNESITSRLLSRLGQAGILFLPNTIQVAGAIEAPTGDGQPVADPFFTRLLDTMEKAILDRTGASGAMPIIVRGPPGEGQNIIHITLDRAIDRVEMELRSELRHNIATGLDLPPEVSTGLAATNHWTSWSVMDSSFRSHLVPLADNFAEGVTRTYLWPALRISGHDEHDIRRFIVVPDGANVVHRPNESEDGRQLYDRSAISATALRRRSGVPEEDQPSEEEYVQQIGMKTNVPYLATWGMKIHKKIDWANVPGAAMAGAPGTGSTPPSKRPADSGKAGPGEPGQGVAGKDPKDEKDAKDPNPNGQPGYSSQVFAAAASGHLLAAQKKVGAMVRSRCADGKHHELFGYLKHTPNERVLAVIDDWDAIGLSTDSVVLLFVDALEPLTIDLLQSGYALNAVERFVDDLAYKAAMTQHSPIGIQDLVLMAISVLDPERIPA